MKRLSMFSWGYSGWGTATPQLVTAVDAAEAGREFEPPIFVDIRFNRAVRAPGFVGNAFGDLLGWRRYRWMPSLGNENIRTGRTGVKIAFPGAAAQLLELAMDASDRQRRVIFFCSCESPGMAAHCHRHTVVNLLERAARRRQVPLDVSEWPGGRPTSKPLSLRVPPDILKAVNKGSKCVPLGRQRIPGDFVALPWGTLVRLHAERDELMVAVGPAVFERRGWVLPRFASEGVEAATDLTTLRLQVARLRREYGLD